MKNTLTLAIISILGSYLSVSAQNKSLTIGRIFGKIIEKQRHESIAFASIAVYQTVNKKDSLVGGMLTKENGEFNISDLAFGKYKVKISFVGFKDMQMPATVAPPENVEFDLGDIALEADNKTMETVEIRAKSTAQLAIDRKIFDVDKNLHASGGTAMDVLKNVPSLSIDGDGAILLRNQTPQIYMDGRPTPLSIQQIPADQIEQIEVITNPSAKFDASSGGGIINLVMKKNKRLGLNGNYAVGIGTGNRYAGMMNLNYKKNPLSMTLFLNGNMSDFGTTGFSNYTFLNNQTASGFLNQNIENTLYQRLFSGRFTVDYAVNNRNTLSLLTSVMLNETGVDEDLIFENLNASNQKISYGNRITSMNNPSEDYTVGTTWRRTFLKKGRELIANMTYGIGPARNDSDFNTENFNGNGLKTTEIQRNRGEAKDAQAVFTLDYSTPINDSTKLETGIRSFWNGRDNLYTTDTMAFSDAAFKPVNYMKFDYRFENYINAAYINMLGKMKKGWSYQAGFRYEQSNFIGKFNSNYNEDFSYHYPSSSQNLLKTLFPSLYLNKKINPTTEWQLNFSRKIGRPLYSHMAPFINFADKSSFRRGNPEIRPEFINLAEVNFNKIIGKVNILSALYFRTVNDPIVFYAFEEKSNENIYVTTFVNGDKNRSYGLDNTLKWSIGKNAEWLTNITVFNSYFKYQNIENEGWALNTKSTFTLKTKKDITCQLTGYYETPVYIPQGTRGGYYYADFSIRKDIWKKTGVISLIINDIFDSKRLPIHYNTPLFLWDAKRRRDARYVRLTLQKRFGKMDASIFKPRKAAHKSVREQSIIED